jgi:osmoprotectant transport system permease protein
VTAESAARSPPFRLNNQVLLALAVAGALAAAAGGFVTLAPNRLVSGHPVRLWDAAGMLATAAIAGPVAALAALAFAPPSRTRNRIAAALAALLFVATLASASAAAHRLAFGASPLARVSLGTAFWILIGASALAIVDGLQRAGAGNSARLLVAAAIVAAAAAMAEAGWFDALALVREYATRRDVFSQALLRHVVLVVGSVAPAIALGVPLGILALRRERAGGAIFATLNLMQTIPSIALFGLLIVPLSGLATAFPAAARLGIGGIGPAPAIIALVLYALLPVARSTAAGLGGVDPGVIDAARGMGMTGRQTLWRVELPLAAPVLLAGLRIVVVQTIGLAVVAALIGAGGLGSFVFDGLGQDAADLVLLGALPAVGLALAADFLLQTAASALSR